MHRSGASVAGIRRRLISMGHTVSRDTISYWIRKFEVGLFGDVCDTSVPTVFSSVTHRDADLIRDCLTRDPSPSSRDIHKVLKEDGATFGHSTTKWAIEATGFTHSKPRYGQMVRDAVWSFANVCLLQTTLLMMLYSRTSVVFNSTRTSPATTVQRIHMPQCCPSRSTR